MGDLRYFLEDVFGGKTPIITHNYKTGVPEQVYYNYDDDREELVEVQRQPINSQKKTFKHYTSEKLPIIQTLRKSLEHQFPNEPILDALKAYETLEKNKEAHYNRQEFVDPDLWLGNGRQILNNEPDLWDCTENAIAHNLNGASGNMDCRGRVGTPREHQQMIVAPDGMIVNSDENMGTYDFVAPDGLMKILEHFCYDVYPWVVWGNNPYDQTDAWDRSSAVIKGLWKSGINYLMD